MKLLTKSDIEKIANQIGVSTSLLYAIDQVESAGCGYYLNEGKWNGELKVLFEGHYFYKFTKGRFSKTRPDLSYPTWTKKYYRKGQEEFSRFMEALKLDKQSALFSTSWGRYQIMGANFKKCGYNSVVEMVTDFYESEQNQIIGFLSFCENTLNKKYNLDLIELLKKFDVTNDLSYLKEFVRNYNGSGQIEKYTARILNFKEKYNGTRNNT